MKCLGCYKKIEKNEYCLSCRKKLFDGKRVPTVLDFEKPKAENRYLCLRAAERQSCSRDRKHVVLRHQRHELSCESL